VAAIDEASSDDFEELIERLRAQPSESEWLEFKQNLADPDEIGGYVSALSNSAALHGETKGYLVWGIQDESHTLVGTSFDLVAAKKGNQSLHVWLLGALKPDPGVAFSAGQVQGHRIAILEVPAATHHPVQFKGTAYIRIGSRNFSRWMSPVGVRRLSWRSPGWCSGLVG